ncbi:putative isomerase YbhE [Auriscalpium vulgare]|uniref:Isomerase YbhE n=1 Tax=Auriscalpium vulgare TaxID=40419 RepID=A0ACB8S3A3_9AGAM|nr:putative isomerase YbhE [Auriscalpium vulgare]
MVNFTILAGGYSTFVASYAFNTDISSLTLQSQSTTGANPSWIALHPTNNSVLYAVNENTDGALQSFLIGSQGQLSGVQGEISSGGNGPAFTAPLSSGDVAIMNFGSGNGLILPTFNAIDFGSAPLITFPASVSNPHMALENGNEVLVPDLGADKIWRLVEDDTPGSWKIQGEIAQPQGSGPRHIAIYNDTLYTVHETASTLTEQPIPTAPNGTSEITAQLSTIPNNTLTDAKFAAAEILIPTPNTEYPDAFIYVSNRNVGNTTDPRGDSIAIYKISPQLHLVAQVYTGLQQVRGMSIGGLNDEFLVAGGVVGDGGIVVYQRTNDGGGLMEIARNKDVPTRTSFVWGTW